MNARTAGKLSGVVLGATLLAHAVTATAALDEGAGIARQRQVSPGALKPEALVREPLRGESLEELRRQSLRQQAAIYRERRQQSAAARDAAAREEAARLIMERAAKD